MTQDGLIDPAFQDPELWVPATAAAAAAAEATAAAAAMDHFQRISTSTSSRITVEPYIPIS